MLTMFLAVQVAVNAVVLAVLWRMHVDRRRAARAQGEREAKLRALVEDMCAMGRDIARLDAPRAEPSAAREEPAAPQREVWAPTLAARKEAAPPRLGEVCRLLDAGEPIATIAARTAMAEGEVEVLRNLRRWQKPSRDRRGGSRTPSESSGCRHVQRVGGG